MIVYWLMFFYPAFFALNERANFSLDASKGARNLTGAWAIFFIFLTLIVGFRDNVGGDWPNYLWHYENVFYSSQNPLWWADDPSYRLLEYLSFQMDLGIYAINLACAAIFAYGIIVFCRNTRRPWLAMTVAIPYLVIILGMGYTRQGVALSCIMVGLVHLSNAKISRFIFWVLLGATFHKSAIVILPVAALLKSSGSSRTIKTAWLIMIIAIAYFFLLKDSIEDLRVNYINAEYQSEGALIRLAMNFVPATIFLLNRKKISLSLPQSQLWVWFSFVSIIAFFLYFASASSTALDRIALYLIPLQIILFSMLPDLFGRKGATNGIYLLGVVLFYGSVQFVWLSFANNAYAWLPYQFYPINFLLE